jgi:hypothetical protein
VRSWLGMREGWSWTCCSTGVAHAEPQGYYPPNCHCSSSRPFLVCVCVCHACTRAC